LLHYDLEWINGEPRAFRWAFYTVLVLFHDNRGKVVKVKIDFEF